MTEFVVTGARGFLGRTLCARLESRGAKVHRVNRGEPLPPLPTATCVHLAGSSAAADYLRPGAREEALALARSTLRFKRVVFASSAQVYGDKVRAPRREDETPEPVKGYAYASTKLELERLFPAPHAIARIANLYGPGQSPENVLSHILKQLPGGGTVRMMGALDATRDYLHVDDAAEALARLALSSESGVFNVGTGVGTSVEDLARALGRLHGVMVKTESPAPRAGSCVVLDPEKTAAALGWRASRTLEEGLKTLLPAGRAG